MKAHSLFPYFLEKRLAIPTSMVFVLVVHWMDGQPAPQAILDLLACNCKRTCQLPSCECLANKLMCTNMCKLPNCGNQAALTYDDGSEDENDDKYEQKD